MTDYLKIKKRQNVTVKNMFKIYKKRISSFKNAIDKREIKKIGNG